MSDREFRYVSMFVFARSIGEGNPAAVCPLDDWPSDGDLSRLAIAIATPVTAFVIDDATSPRLRWFTRAGRPVASMCGHGTLAGARLLAELHPDRLHFTFDTPGGLVPVARRDDSLSVILPRWEATAIETPSALVEALGAVPTEVLDAGRDVICVFDRESDVRGLRPNMAALSLLRSGGTIATARGAEHDCVSRFFCPTFGLGVDEDFVTGSAHCSIAPLWCRRLGKTVLRAFQASERGGELFCELLPTGVRITAPVTLGGWNAISMGAA